MDWVKKQERLQERVFEAIEELADEFDLEVPYYPTVYYIGVGTPKYSEREKSLKEIVDPSYFLYMQRYWSGSKTRTQSPALCLVTELFFHRLLSNDLVSLASIQLAFVASSVAL